jgi:hypothetical protein
MMGIKVIKKKKTTGYTFIDDGPTLKSDEEHGDDNNKRDKTGQEYRLRGEHDKSINQLKHKSKLSGGQRMQGHSSVYE